MVLTLFIYFSAGVLWGVFAANMQSKVHPYSSSWLVALVLLLNALGWPIAMMIAIHHLMSGKHDKYFVATKRQE